MNQIVAPKGTYRKIKGNLRRVAEPKCFRVGMNVSYLVNKTDAKKPANRRAPAHSFLEFPSDFLFFVYCVQSSSSSYIFPSRSNWVLTSSGISESRILCSNWMHPFNSTIDSHTAAIIAKELK